MNSQIKCPAEEYLHYAGVNLVGIKKHIYSCKALKKKDEQTKVFQCQYCSLHFFLNKNDLEDHTNLCGFSFKEKMPWLEKLHMIIIEPDPNIKINDQPQPCKNWQYYRNIKEKKKEKKRLSLHEPSEENISNISELQKNKAKSSDRIDSPEKTKKIKPNNEQEQNENEKAKGVTILSEELMKENDERNRMNYLEEINSKMKVDNYQDAVFD